MCQLKSGILLKDRVFIPDYDSHEDMLGELKIKDTEENAKRLFVRAELIPPNDDVFTPVSEWKYRVDQDILPDWYVPEVDEKRMRDAVAEWENDHIHVGKKIEEITSGLHWIKDGTVGVIGGSAEIIELCGSAKVDNICGYAKVGNVCESATVVNVYDYAKVENVFEYATVVNVYDYAKVVNVYGCAKVVKICDSATVMTDSVSKWYNADGVCIKDDAVLIDRYDKKIYHAGAYETVIAGGQKK